MRTTRVLAIVAILGIAFSFRASANVVYDSETTNEWFNVNMSTLKAEDLKAPLWTPPKDGGEATVEDKVIKLDTDLGDPLTYTAARSSEAVAIVAAEMTATVNASVPDLKDVPQAALCVIGTETATNWVGLVGVENGGTNWVTFSTPVPVAGETYSVRIEFDQRPGETRQIRYRVDNTVLGDGWYLNPQNTVTANIKSVSFSGTGDISGLGGSNVVANAATFNGVGYTTFAEALAAAKAAGTGWNDANPIVLYENANWTAETRIAYFNENGHTLTISDGVYTQSGNTYTVTAQKDCEAKIDTTYYVTFDEAVTAAKASDVIVVNKTLEKSLTVAKSYSLNPNDKLTCATLTVNADQTLTLAGGLAVTTATINGTVAGETLTVSGTLTGVNVAKLTFGNGATFAYAGAKLAPAELTQSGTLTITGLDTAASGTEVVAAAGLDLSKISATLPQGRCLEMIGNTLTVVDVATITASSETAGYDFTNGTVSVTTSVKSGKTGMATLRVIDFVTGRVVVSDAKQVSGTAAVSTWDLSDRIDANLQPGGTYGYTVDVTVDGKVAATASGTFTAANWDSDLWFGADPTATPKTVNGSWVSEPEIVDSQYALKGDSVFDLGTGVPTMGTDRVSRIDAKVTYDALSDSDLEVVEGMFSGFTAVAEENGDTKWMALSSVNSAAAWVELTGAITPAAAKPYVIRAELDFLSPTARVRYLVSEDDGATFVSLASATGTWLPLALPKTQLDGIVLKGNSSLAKLEAKVSDKALAEVGGVKYEDTTAAMNAALAAGASVELLTYATLKPTAPGAYTISANGFGYKVEVPNGDWTYSTSGDTLTVVRKETPSNKDVTASALTYGQALTESVLSGTVTNEAGTAVAGTLAWVNEDQIYPNVQDAATNRLYEVALTPENPDLYKSATLKIPVPVNRAELAVFVKDETIAQGDAVPAFSYTEITGFVRGESQSVVSGTATFTTTYTTDSPVGTYPIAYASGLAADNYSFVSSNGTLTVVAAATIDAVTVGEGFDFTNGTVSATVSVSSAKGGTVALKVVNFATGAVIGTYGKKNVDTGTETVSWDLTDAIADGLVPGGTYSYEIEVTVDGKTADADGGTFTAANWDSNLWFGADPTADPETVNGSWNKRPAVGDDHCYAIEDSSIFSLTDETPNKGTNRVSHVDAKVTFETLVDGDADIPGNDPIGAFVATTDGWKALANDGNEITWIGLTGVLAPQAGAAYTVRAELDFLSETKRVRYLVSTDGENFAALATTAGNEWINLTANKTTLASVELSGAGKLANLAATLSDRAIAEVNGVKYDTMDEALEAAGTEGTNTIKILTNATINPTEPGSYDIAPGGHYYVSGGEVSTDPINTKTIVVTEPGQPPVVRPSTATMKLVETPEGAHYKDINKLRVFLERNGVAKYQNENATANDITGALNNESGKNNLKLWQDYALGVDKDTPVAPVTKPAGDTDSNNITLAIPAVVAATPSGDYTVTYKVVVGEGTEAKSTSADAGAITIPLSLGTGTYKIKAVFDPAE